MVRETARRGARFACLAACAGLGLLALPAFASAGTVSVSSGTAHFVGASGEYNNLQITDSGSTVEFHALKGTAFMSGVGCAQNGPDEVDCPQAIVDRLLVDLGTGIDRVKNSSSIPMTANGGDDEDTLIGGSGHDVLNGNADADFLDGRGGADRMNGGGGRDVVSYASRHHRVHAAIDGKPHSGERHEGDTILKVEGLLGGSSRDTLIGSRHSDLLAGGRGADTIIGHGGRDGITGGPGNDFLRGDAGADSINGGAGKDIIKGGGGIDQISGGNDNRADRINCGSSIDYAVKHKHDRLRNCEGIVFRG